MEREFEAGDMVIMTFDYIDAKSRARLKEGTPVILVDGPFDLESRSGIYWLILSPGGIVINVPQAYFNYDRPVYRPGV